MWIRAAVVAMLATASAAAQSASPQVWVPFVGCPSEGQAGPFDPPKGSPKAVALPAELAGRIAVFHEGYLSILRLRLGANLDDLEGVILRLNQECMLNVRGC